MPTKRVSKRKPAVRPASGKPSSGDEVIRSLITKFEEQTKQATFKISVSDFLRLLQFEREYSQEGPKDVRVAWIEPTEDSKS